MFDLALIECQLLSTSPCICCKTVRFWDYRLCRFRAEGSGNAPDHPTRSLSGPTVFA